MLTILKRKEFYGVLLVVGISLGIAELSIAKKAQQFVTAQYNLNNSSAENATVKLTCDGRSVSYTGSGTTSGPLFYQKSMQVGLLDLTQTSHSCTATISVNSNTDTATFTVSTKTTPAPDHLKDGVINAIQVQTQFSNLCTPNGDSSCSSSDSKSDSKNLLVTLDAENSATRPCVCPIDFQSK